MRDWEFLHEEQLLQIEGQIGEVAGVAESAKSIARSAENSANTANLNSQAANIIAQGAKTDASTALREARTAQGTADSVRGIAEAAQSTAEAAQSTAESVRGIAEDAQSTAEAAQSTAEAAQSTAEAAQSTAETAQSTAETAQSTAAQALADAATALAAAATAQADATDAKGDASQALADAATAIAAAAAAQSDASQALADLATKANISDLPGMASDTDAGLVKLNTPMSIYLDGNGNLMVGGRLGQFPNGGVYYPDTIEPVLVGSSTFLMTDGAKGLSAGSREFNILAGANLNIRSAAAGSTVYRAVNSLGNRIICAAALNGFCAIDQSDAQNNGTAKITDISFANGDPISFYFGADEPNNDIIITVERSVNPNAATSILRMYGNSSSTDTIVVGQGVGCKNGKAIVLGQSCFGGGNQIIALGNGVHVMANNSSGFGHTILINKQFCFAAGQGHDFTNASNGTSALGIWSKLESDTAAAIGNGTDNVARSNALEVKKSGALVVPSNTGSKRFSITVDDSGTVTTTEII